MARGDNERTWMRLKLTVKEVREIKAAAERAELTVQTWVRLVLERAAAPPKKGQRSSFGG